MDFISVKRKMNLSNQTSRFNNQLISNKPIDNTSGRITITEVNRVLEVGRLLFSVLTEEEVADLQQILNGPSNGNEIGNAGVT